MFDLILRHGTVIDGSKAPRVQADVAISGDRIAAVGDLAAAEARQVLDVRGRVVAPGFIDVHNHSDGWLLKTPNLTPKTMQGFTTEVLMSDGISYAPVSPQTAAGWMFYLRALDGLRMDEYRGWQSLAGFMQQLDRRAAQNAATHIPYANLRSMICGWGRQRVDDFQMRQLQYEVRRGMDEGAVGLSTGLDYIVQCFSTTEELIEAATAMAAAQGLYVTHMRYKKGLMPALKEAVEIGRRAGVPVHISHLRAPQPAQADEVLSYIDNVARNEVSFSFDVYPYQPGSTMLSYLLPYEVWEQGPLAVPDRLLDADIRRKFEEGLHAYRLTLGQIRIAWVASKENSGLQGMVLSDYIAQSGLSAADALCNLLWEERLGVLLVFNEGDDALVEPFLKHDLYMMGTDGIHCPDGPIHPRMYGSAPRLLGPCVRDKRLFSLEEAVWKLSGHAGQRFGLTQRGQIKEGWFADLVVFDPETITDPATHEDPHQYPVGIGHVLVNGEFVVRDSVPVEFAGETLPGRTLRYHAD